MPTTFKALKDELHLENEKQLGILRDWCHTHISSDVEYDGSDADRYEEYLALAQAYLDRFLPNCTTDYKKRSADLSGLTAIQFAAYRGYDHYLSTLSDLSPDIVNHPSPAGMTPLHLAASGGHPLIVDFLLSHGAIAIKTNIKKQLPLFTALLVLCCSNLGEGCYRIYRAPRNGLKNVSRCPLKHPFFYILQKNRPIWLSRHLRFSLPR